MSAAECRRKAEELELMIAIVSYRPDRERLTAQARYWRAEEAKALRYSRLPSVAPSLSA